MENQGFEQESENHTAKEENENIESKEKSMETIKSDESNQENPVLEEQKVGNKESDEANHRHTTSEEPEFENIGSDEPDGGKKKDLPVKESSKKNRKSVNFLTNEADADGSDEENKAQNQLERYV